MSQVVPRLFQVDNMLYTSAAWQAVRGFWEVLVYNPLIDLQEHALLLLLLVLVLAVMCRCRGQWPKLLAMGQRSKLPYADEAKLDV